MGDINSSSCFDLCSVPFACCDGAGGILLQNITSINGGPPGGGGTGGNPAPPSGSIQFNTAGSFSGSANLLWDNTNAHVNIAGTGAPGVPKPGVYLSEPLASKNGMFYVDQVGLHFDTGPNTAWYAYTPNDILMEAGAEILFVATGGGYAFQFATAANGELLLLGDSGIQANVSGIQVWNAGHTTPYFVMDTTDGSTYFAGPMGIGVTPTSPYALDVDGNVNASGCYYIFGASFACTDGAGGVALSSITSINGQPPGGGAGSQTPWLSDIDGAGHGLSNVTSVYGIPSQDAGGPGYISFSQYGQTSVYSATQATLASTNSTVLAEPNQITLQSDTIQMQGDSTSQTNVYVNGICHLSGPSVPLQVTGSVNATACYEVGGVTFACFDGASGVNLTNVTSINGGSPGGGGAAQTPWLSNIDAANYALNNLNSIQNSSSDFIWYDNSGNPLMYVQNNGFVSVTGGPLNAGAGLYIQTFPFASVNGVTGMIDLTNVGDINGSPYPPPSGASQTPWTSNIDAAGFSLNNAGSVGIGVNPAQYALDVAGDINIDGSQHYRIDGVPFAGWDGATGVAFTNITSINGAPYPPPSGQSQTPWLSNIDGGGFQLLNAGQIGIFTNTVGTDTIRVQTQAANPMPAAINLNSALTPNQYSSMRLAADSGNYVTLQVSGTTNATTDKCQFLIGTTDLHFNASGTPLTIQRSGIPASYVGIQNTAPAYPLDIGGDCNIAAGSVYRIGGVPLSTGGGGFWVGGSGGAIYYNGGNVGIGTATPGAELEVTGLIRSIGGGANPTTGVGVNITYSGTTGFVNAYDFGAGAYRTLAISGAPLNLSAIDATNGIITFGVNSPTIEAMCISLAGNVGIGNTTPQTPLFVSRNANATPPGTPPNSNWNQTVAYFSNADGLYTRLLLDYYGNTAVYSPAVTFRAAAGTGAAPLALAAGQQMGVIQAYGWNGSAWAGSRAAIFIFTAEAWGTNNNGTYISLQTSAVGAPSQQEVMRVQNLGVAIGGSITPAYQLHLTQDSAGKPSTNTWTVTSDIRTKRNVQRFYGDIDIIRSLDPIVAEYNGFGNTPEGARVVGFSAQDLQQILPQCVTEDTAGVLGVNTHEIFFHMLRAIQYLDQQVTYLTQRLEAA